MNKKNKAIIAFIAISAPLALCALAVLTAVLSAYQKKTYAEEDPIVFIMMASCNHTWSVARRIKAGVDVNATNFSGTTALMYAAHSNAVDTTRLLIKAGADVDAKDKFAETALMYAAQNNAADTTKLLIESGADVLRPRLAV